VQLTSGADGENSPRWSPDARRSPSSAKRDDNEFAQIYLMPIDGGEARPLTTHATAVSDIAGRLMARRCISRRPRPKTPRTRRATG